MRIHATVSEGGTVTEVTVPPASLLAYEEEQQTAIKVEAATGGIRWFLWVTWHALTLRHGETRTFEEWSAQVDAVDDTTQKAIEAAASGPTGPTTAPSSATRRGSSSGQGSPSRKRAPSKATSARRS